MDRRVVFTTLLIAALFAVGGVILQTHGGGSIYGSGSFFYSEGDWTFSVAAEAHASGACAYALPDMPGWDKKRAT